MLDIAALNSAEAERLNGFEIDGTLPAFTDARRAVALAPVDQKLRVLEAEATRLAASCDHIENAAIVDLLTDIATANGLVREYGYDTIQHVLQVGLSGATAFASLLGEPEDIGSEKHLRTVDAHELHGRTLPLRQEHVPGLIPARNVTLFTGDGGTGKSLLALQLAASTALSTGWIGFDVTPGRVLCLIAEDELDEIHRRLTDIVTAYGHQLSDLTNLRIVPLAGEDAVLAAPSPRTNLIATTELFAKVKSEIANYRPKLLLMDTLADLFGGEENQRAQARQFISLIRGLSLAFDLTAVLLAHPSLSGLAAGTGSSGSTGWGNSVRSRLFLSRVLDEAKQEADPDLRVLRTTKANYGRTGGEVRLRWCQGVFMPEQANPTGMFDHIAANQAADSVFLDCLRMATAQGRQFSPSRCSTFAPTCFARMPEAKGYRANVLAMAMERLLSSGAVTVTTKGPPSKQRAVLTLPQGMAEEGA